MDILREIANKMTPADIYQRIITYDDDPILPYVDRQKFIRELLGLSKVELLSLFFDYNWGDMDRRALCHHRIMRNTEAAHKPDCLCGDLPSLDTEAELATLLPLTDEEKRNQLTAVFEHWIEYTSKYLMFLSTVILAIQESCVRLSTSVSVPLTKMQDMAKFFNFIRAVKKSDQ